MITEREVDELKIRIYPNRIQLGTAAAQMAADRIQELLAEKETVNIIFAAAASQNEFLERLNNMDIDWSRINAFHMDEYIGLPKDAPQLFGQWLTARIFGRHPFREVFFLDGQAEDPEVECMRYTELLLTHPVDIVFMGVGENTHLAFNDPHVADFKDTRMVKIVDIDQASKQQQVNEGCFPDPSQVPSYAYTLTVPALLKADTILCMVPSAKKAQAIYHTLNNEINERYPSTIIRQHPNTILFLDKDSSSMLK